MSCFPTFRLQAGNCVHAGRQWAEGLRSWAGSSSQAVEDAHVDGLHVGFRWDASALRERPASMEVFCVSLLRSCYKGSPNLDTCPYRCSLLMLENSLRQTVDLYLSLL